MGIKKNEILFTTLSIDGGRTSLIQGTTDMCEEKLFLNNEMGHISTNIFVLLWVVIGDQELPTVITRVSDLALFISL